MAQENELRKQMGWLDAASVVVGIVIGAGIFVTPQDLARVLPSSDWMMLAWLVSGALVFCGALAFAELSAMLPSTGGLYIYLREAFGPAVAFSSGWVHLFALFSGATAYIASSFSRYLTTFVPMNDSAQKLAAIGLVLILALLNSRSALASVWVQNTANAAKLFGLLLLIGLAFFATPATAQATPPLSLSAFSAGLASCFFCYEGWSYAGFVAGEMRKPQRDLPRAFAFSFLAVLALYLLVNVAYLRVLSVAELQASAQVGADVARKVFGGSGAALLSGIILLAIIGSVNGLTLAAARMYLAQSRDALFLPTLDQVHPQWATPVRATMAHALVTSAFIYFSPNMGFILQLAISAAWFYYALAVAGLIRLRFTRAQLERPYRMWGYPVTPLLFIGGALQFLFSLYMSAPQPVLVMFAILLISFPAYALIRQLKGARSTASVAS